MRIPRGLFLAFGVLLPVAAWPQVLVGPEFRVNGYTTDMQYPCDAAALGNGDFIVVWTSALFSPFTDFGTFGRRFDAQGTPLAPEFRVDSLPSGLNRQPTVAGSSSGFVVAWSNDYQDGSGYGVYAQRYDASGARLGTNFRVNTWTTGDQVNTAASMAPDGHFVIAWTSDGQDGDSVGVYARRYAADGIPVGGEIRLNVYTTSAQDLAAIATLPAGEFVAVWSSFGQDGSAWGVFGRRYDAAGNPAGTEFRVNSTTAGQQTNPSLASGGPGFVVAWNGDDGDQYGVFAQRYGNDGTPRGSEFRINSVTTGMQAGWPRLVAVDGAGNFGIAWAGETAVSQDMFARFFNADASPRSAEMRVNTYTTGPQGLAAIAADSQGRFVVSWASTHGGSYDVYAQRFATVLAPSALTVDPSPSGSSDGNEVLEACETVAVVPSWNNVSSAALSVSGSASSFTGPTGATYSILDGAAAYGTITAGGSAPCTDCYAMTVSCATPRPAQHWDPTFIESLSPLPAAQRWALHVGDSFTDVPRTNLFYRFVETLLHHEVTAGCGQGLYCPLAPTTREQMAAFVLAAKEGAGYSPPACAPPNVFADVPESSPFCRFIEELFNRGVVGGCGGGNYCPGAAVTREQMAVFVLRTLDPALSPPDCTTPVFADVPASSPFCRWIEELARRGVVTGCGGGNYCPTQPVTREQMGVFLSATFGLALYGP